MSIIEHDSTWSCQCTHGIERRIVNLCVAECYILHILLQIDGSQILIPTVGIGTATYKDVVFESNALIVAELISIESCIQVNTCCHEHIADVVVVNMMTATAIERNATCTPDKLDGVISEDIVLLILGVHITVVPTSQAIIAIIADGAVIDCCIACTLTEVDTISKVVTNAAIDNLHAIAIVHSTIIVAKPKTCLEVFLPHIVNHRAVTEHIHEALVYGLLIIARAEIRVDIHVAEL